MSKPVIGRVPSLYNEIRAVLNEARSRARQAVNSEMVACYWQIGRLIVNDEQKGAARADYGREIIRELSARLTAEFGAGFDKSNLWNMRAFFLATRKSTRCVENCPGPTTDSFSPKIISRSSHRVTSFTFQLKKNLRQSWCASVSVSNWGRGFWKAMLNRRLNRLCFHP